VIIIKDYILVISLILLSSDNTITKIIAVLGLYYYLRGDKKCKRVVKVQKK
jgi:hypothetical protein